LGAGAQNRAPDGVFLHAAHAGRACRAALGV